MLRLCFILCRGVGKEKKEKKEINEQKWKDRHNGYVVQVVTRTFIVYEMEIRHRMNRCG